MMSPFETGVFIVWIAWCSAHFWWVKHANPTITRIIKVKKYKKHKKKKKHKKH